MNSNIPVSKENIKNVIDVQDTKPKDVNVKSNDVVDDENDELQLIVDTTLEALNPNHHNKKPQGQQGQGDQSQEGGQTAQSGYNAQRNFNQPCRYFAWGNCRRGDTCFYQHVKSAVPVTSAAVPSATTSSAMAADNKIATSDNVNNNVAPNSGSGRFLNKDPVRRPFLGQQQGKKDGFVSVGRKHKHY